MSAQLLKNGRVIDPGQNIDGIQDVLIKEGKIAAIAADIHCEDGEQVDCSGLWITPGLVDGHCHLREPGAVHKETIASGTRAAAKGGFTTVLAMANVTPVPATLKDYRKIQSIIEQTAAVHVVQAASVTKDLKGRDLCDMATLAAAGVKVFSDDGYFIDRAAVLYQALKLAAKLDVTLALHEEDTSLKLYWPTAYEPLNEIVAIARDLEILRVTGGKVHFQHISTARGVELIRKAKREKLSITAEVCPHHLVLTQEAIYAHGTNAKMAPPLRTVEDIAELIKGLDDGTIDLIATDHAPHAEDDKNTVFDLAANGIIGFETALPLMLSELVQRRGFSPSWLIERMSTIPARVFSLPGGSMAVGAPADICVIDPNRQWVIDRQQMASMSRNTPFHGTEVKGAVMQTFVGGKLIYQL
ncbi:dihydroorotase [Anaerospora hongkongensis]|uniref:dihydroorotase n=3 Tax=Anaerospora hongkongensis TaxID=244830 RepID=UPI002FD9E5BC